MYCGESRVSIHTWFFNIPKEEDKMNLTQRELCEMIDYALLSPCVTNEEIQKFCMEARRYGVKMVLVNSAVVPWCKNNLIGSDVRVGAAISYPLGQTPLSVKLYEAMSAIDNGVDEIDYVVNIGRMKMGDYDYVELEMESMVTLCRQKNIICKVIFENCYLNKEEILKLCLIANKIKPDFIKTSTGLGSAGASKVDVKLMRSLVHPAIEVKAAGGLKNFYQVKEMVEVGATRIGTSNLTTILAYYS